MKLALTALSLAYFSIVGLCRADFSPVEYRDDIILTPISYVPTMIMVVVTLLITVSVALALTWAGKSGQFENLSSSAETIFDEGEPVGQVTDKFPPHKPRKNKRRLKGVIV